MNPGTASLALATRGSALALWQARAAERALRAGRADLGTELVPIESRGDRDQRTALERFGGVGVFTAEVDAAVLDGRARIGVHSLKDVPTSLPDGLVLAGVLARGPVEDALVARGGLDLAALPAGARVGTGSVRRAAMLQAARPDLEVAPARGNVETRVALVDRGELDAVVLALAGLERLGLAARATQVLPRARFLPAPCQGIVGLVCRADDAEARAHCDRACDREAAAEALAERALLRALHGGCNAPLGALARARDNALSLSASVLSRDGREHLEGSVRGSIDAAEKLGRELAERLRAQGADRLIAAARGA